VATTNGVRCCLFTSSGGGVACASGRNNGVCAAPPTAGAEGAESAAGSPCECTPVEDSGPARESVANKRSWLPKVIVPEAGAAYDLDRDRSNGERSEDVAAAGINSSSCAPYDVVRTGTIVSAAPSLSV
jgi:hypothetical protein